MKKQSFITGAFLLALATGMGKIFSAVFKIPMDRFFLHAEGMAVFNSAYNIYVFFFSLATAGIPMAISAMIASRREDKNTVLSTAILSLFLFLTCAGLFIFIFADCIASFIGIKEAAASFRVMAPALIFCAFTASLRGYFQGSMFMTPSALSQSLDSFGRLAAGFTMAFLLSSCSTGVISAGAMCGIPFGAALSAGVLIFAFKKSGSEFTIAFSPAILKNLLAFAVPIAVTSSMNPIFNAIDTFTVVPVMTKLGYISPKEAFGFLSRGSMLYALPVSIASAIAAGVLPSISGSVKNCNNKAVNDDISLALRLSLVVSLPCTAGFMAIPDGLFRLLFGSPCGANVLFFIAPSAVFLSAGTVISCVLQGLGKTKYCVISSALGIFSKFVLNMLFIRFWGINGSAVSTTVSFCIFLLSLLFFLSKTKSVAVNITSDIIKPVFCGAVCFVISAASSGFFPVYITILCAAVAYIPSLFVTGAIRPGEINQIFSVR